MHGRRYPHIAFITLCSALLLRADFLSYVLKPETPRYLTFCNEPESCFALAIKIPFSQADHYALQLVPRITEDIADNLLAQRDAIYANARRLPSDRSAEAFQLAKGVGPTLALDLDRRFSLR